MVGFAQQLGFIHLRSRDPNHRALLPAYAGEEEDLGKGVWLRLERGQNGMGLGPSLACILAHAVFIFQVCCFPYSHNSWGGGMNSCLVD